mmetsp:Transcript_5008/g.12125  ORF Transcript_5008/g.12125 Transcript_5008/m.12125 type:complete len:177 (-) Transcript_5008:45-575(-)
MSELSWSVMLGKGMRKKIRDCYFISDGGYTRVIQLSFSFKHAEPNSLHWTWSKMIESVRKDVECTFGCLKKRFLWLKHWNCASTHKQIDDVFTTCAILHNILLEEDGYLNYDEDLSSGNPFSEERGDGSWERWIPADWVPSAPVRAAYENENHHCARWEMTCALFTHYDWFRKHGL